MERRHGTRRPTEVEAILITAQAKRQSARIRDASLSGIFIETVNGSLRPNMPIQLEFIKRWGDAVQAHTWRGFVVRVATNGVGAAFESGDPADRAGLLALIGTAPPEVPSPAASPGSANPG